jgi:hypothetical protein
MLKNLEIIEKKFNFTRREEGARMGVRRGEGKYPAPLGLRQIQMLPIITL